MEKLRKVWMVAAVVLVGGVAIAEKQQPAPPSTPPPIATTTTTTPSRDATLKDIEKTIGFVPAFFREIPAAMLPGFWELMKNFEMGTTTRIDAKTKELIGIAVASQIPCDYCIQFHREAARKHGATDQEVQEAIGMAAMTRLGSTVLNGLQIDKAQFKRDLDRMSKNGNNRQTSRRP
jgi:AhpD family alkylhydroperoxidase